MKVVQSKCIQTILGDSGQLLNYRLTLPIPARFGKVSTSPYVKSPRPNRYFYTREFTDFDYLITVMKHIQLHVTNLKIRELRLRKESLFHDINQQYEK